MQNSVAAGINRDRLRDLVHADLSVIRRTAVFRSGSLLITLRRGGVAEGFVFGSREVMPLFHQAEMTWLNQQQTAISDSELRTAGMCCLCVERVCVPLLYSPLN